MNSELSDGYALAGMAVEVINPAVLVEDDHPQANLRELRLAAEAFLAQARGRDVPLQTAPPSAGEKRD